jgi:hypothetical protein
VIPDSQRRTRGARRQRIFPASSFASAGSARSALIVVLAILFLAFHLPYLPTSLEDLDSINFALGVRDFDVAEHQPHPPGYPLFILAAKGAHVFVRPEHRALSALGVLAGSLGVLAIAALFRRIEGLTAEAAATSETAHTDRPFARHTEQPIAEIAHAAEVVKRRENAASANSANSAVSAVWVFATGLAIASPMYWFTAARPLSDTTGLAVAIAVQVLILAARTDRTLAVAAWCAALAAGVRSQVVWLTLPLLIVRLLASGGAQETRPDADRQRPEREPFRRAAIDRIKASGYAALAYVAGVLVWFVPLVILTGGPARYWNALSFQGTADLSDIRMLWTTPTPRELIDALYYAFIAPWAAWPLAAAVVVLSAAGLAWLALRRRGGLAILFAAFGPYFLFDILFQETFTSRYALPLVIPVAYLATAGAALLPRRVGYAIVVMLAVVSAHVGGTSVASYAHQKAPAFRLLEDMRTTAPAVAPVLAMDRREEFDLRRPIRWVGEAMISIADRLPSPPQHEWLELVKYWNGGGRAPVWFVADPKRTDVDLIQHSAPVEYRWPLPYPVLIDGVRPNEMDWHRIERPEWYVDNGWALTPESAGVAQVDGKGLSAGPISGWVHRSVLGGAVRKDPRGAFVVGGRNFDPTARRRLTLSIGSWTNTLTVTPGAFLYIVRLPNAAEFGSYTQDYVPIQVRAEPPSPIAIEQFDMSRERPVRGFGEGWHEQEYNPATGLRWRWLSEHGELHVLPPATGGPMALHLEGESPRRYFSRGSRLVVRAGDRVLVDRTLDTDFALDIPIAATPNVIEPQVLTLETDQTYIPAERGWRRTADRRHLGLRIFRCDIRAATPSS